jgi:hypothetical protein
LEQVLKKGERQGIFSHGDLSPWRLVCKNDGQVQILGLGLPQIEIVAMRENASVVPREDAFRYCPPERIEGSEEDFSSDLLSLTLIATEMIIGEPLYNGTPKEIQQQATNGQGPYRLYAHRDKMPEPVVDLFSRCLKFDFDARHAEIGEFLWEVKDLLGMPEIEGPSLDEVVQKAKTRLRRRKALQSGSSDGLSPEELVAIAARETAKKETARPPEPEEPAARWGRSTRTATAAPTPAAPATAQDRLRERLRGSGGGPPGAPSSPAPPSPPSDARAALKDRLSRSGGAPSRPGEGPARDLRRSAEPAPARVAAPPAPLPAETAPPPAPAPDEGARARASSLLKRLRSSRDETPEPTGNPAGPRGRHMKVSVDGGAPRDVWVEPSSPACVLAWRAIEQLGGPPMAFTGTVEGWFVMSQGGEPVSSETPVGSLGDGVVDLHYKAGKLVSADIEVRGSQPARFRAPVHTALPAGAVLDQILRALELPGEGWQISAGGHPLHPLQPLGEVAQGSDLHLVVNK